MIDTIFTNWTNAIGMDFFNLVFVGLALITFIYSFIRWALR